MTEIIGKTEEEAERTLQEQGKRMRVARRDGKGYMLTMEYMPERINVEVHSGKITRIASVG